MLSALKAKENGVSFAPIAFQYAIEVISQGDIEEAGQEKVEVVLERVRRLVGDKFIELNASCVLFVEVSVGESFAIDPPIFFEREVTAGFDGDI